MNIVCDNVSSVQGWNISIQVKMQINLKLLVELIFVVLWIKQFLSYYRQFVGLSKWVGVLILLWTGILTMDKGKYKYGSGKEGKKEPRWDGLQLEVKVWIYIVSYEFCLLQRLRRKETPMSMSISRTHTPLLH